MIRQLLTALGLFAFFSLTAATPGGIVRGKVVDSKNGEPLAGVYVVYGKSLGTTTGSLVGTKA